MNKSELISQVSKKTGLSKSQVEKVLTTIISTIIKTLSSNEKVTISGFGTFMVRERIARTGRNPLTGELIKIKASKSVIFKAGRLLNDSIETIESDDIFSLINAQGEKSDFDDKFSSTMAINYAAAPAAAMAAPEDKITKPNYAIMNVFYATDRKQNEKASIKSRFGIKRGELTYGRTEVSIPRDHRMGELESNSIWKLELRENPEKHIIMLDIIALDKNRYYRVISEKVTRSKNKSALIFVHGYNVTFEDAARRTAQMSYDLGFDGAAVFYSWPSHGSGLKYTFDEENIKWSEKNIEEFLRDFTEKSNADNIYLIAHSMGNRALVNAYISLVNSNPSLKSRFTEIILAAPDIDAEIFKRDIAPAMVQVGNPVTLYASSEDIPLKASKKFHGGYPRAGDSADNLLVIPGIESIDSTNVETGFLGHSYYADERSIISDIFYILTMGLRANNRAGLKKISSSSGAYWKFKK